MKPKTGSTKSYADRPRKPTPLLAVEQMTVLAETIAALDMPVHVLNPLAAALQEKFESLPVHWEGVKKGWTLGFVLAGDEWWPCSNIIEIEQGILAGGAMYRIDYEDGSVESGPVAKYKWAHCMANDMPNYHWLDPLPEPEPDPVDPCPELTG